MIAAALVLTVTVAYAGAVAAVRRGTARNGLTMAVWAAPWWVLLVGMAVVVRA